MITGTDSEKDSVSPSRNVSKISMKLDDDIILCEQESAHSLQTIITGPQSSIVIRDPKHGSSEGRRIPWGACASLYQVIRRSSSDVEEELMDEDDEDSGRCCLSVSIAETEDEEPVPDSCDDGRWPCGRFLPRRKSEFNLDGVIYEEIDWELLDKLRTGGNVSADFVERERDPISSTFSGHPKLMEFLDNQVYHNDAYVQRAGSRFRGRIKNTKVTESLRNKVNHKDDYVDRAECLRKRNKRKVEGELKGLLSALHVAQTAAYQVERKWSASLDSSDKMQAENKILRARLKKVEENWRVKVNPMLAENKNLKLQLVEKNAALGSAQNALEIHKGQVLKLGTEVHSAQSALGEERAQVLMLGTEVSCTQSALRKRRAEVMTLRLEIKKLEDERDVSVAAIKQGKLDAQRERAAQARKDTDAAAEREKVARAQRERDNALAQREIASMITEARRIEKLAFNSQLEDLNRERDASLLALKTEKSKLEGDLKVASIAVQAGKVKLKASAFEKQLAKMTIAELKETHKVQLEQVTNEMKLLKFKIKQEDKLRDMVHGAQTLLLQMDNIRSKKRKLKPEFSSEDSLLSVQQEPTLLGETDDPVDSDQETDMGTQGGDDVGESKQQTDSNDRLSEKSFGEGKQKTRHKRQKTFGEVQLYARQDCTSNRHQTSFDLLNSVQIEGGLEARSIVGKSRAFSVEPTEVPQRSTTKRTKDRQNGAGIQVLTTGPGSSLEGPSRFADRDMGRRAAQPIASKQELEGKVENVIMLEKLDEDSTGSRQHLTTGERSSGSSRWEHGRREQVVDKDRVTILEKNTPLHVKNGRGKKTKSKPADRNKKDLSWLLLTDVEAGTRYIPQYGDDVVYLRQGHQEFLDETQSEEKGPWRIPKFSIRAVEFCNITELEYGILPDSGQTCCRLTLKFTDIASKVFGKSFKLTLLKLTNFPDFIVERSRYDSAMKKGWGPRDKCKVWWRSDDEIGGGQWWDGRVVKTKPKSPEYPESPWDRFYVTYKLDSNSNEPTSHSPWELFEPGNHWHDPPHIDEESKGQILHAIRDLEKTCYVGSEDEFGLRRLSQDIGDPDYLNGIPLPLDLEIIKQRLEKDYYHSLEAFRHDVQLLIVNTMSYYGRDSEMTGRMQRLGEFLFDVIAYEEDSEQPSSDGNDDQSDDDR